MLGKRATVAQQKAKLLSSVFDGSTILDKGILEYLGKELVGDAIPGQYSMVWSDGGTIKATYTGADHSASEVFKKVDAAADWILQLGKADKD